MRKSLLLVMMLLLPSGFARASTVPAVAITSPANESTFTSGSNIPIAVSVTGDNRSINEVFFYDRTYFLGSSTTAPYTYIWTKVPAGDYSLTVEATDSSGATLISAPINISVISPPKLLKRPSSGPLAPLIDITSPANQSTVKEGSNLRITVDASEANGAIANVYYYNGTTLIGMSTTPPFTYTWGNVPAGTLTLTAQATDVDGVSSASSPISVTATGDQGS
jgi:Bacterial Ig domain